MQHEKADRVDRAAFVAKSLADSLFDELATRGLACTRILIEAETEHGEELCRLWRHDGALTALNAVVDATGLNLPNDDLIAKAGVNNREIAAELADNAEAGQIVNALEQQYDAFVEGQERPSLLATEAEDLPSADELGADIEEFLRNVSDD